MSELYLLSLWRGRIPIKPTMAQIFAAVCADYDVEPDLIRSRHRFPDAVIPRQEAMLRMVETGQWTLPQVGRFFDRDHSTVIFAVRRAKARRELARAA
jgi:chromosomal replication initiator protein